MKVLGLELNADLDAFHPMVASCMMLMKGMMKQSLLSNITQVCDMLGWCSLFVITLKTLMQRLREDKLGWDEDVAPCILEVWEKWLKQLL